MSAVKKLLFAGMSVLGLVALTYAWQSVYAANESISSPAANSSTINTASTLTGISINGTGNDQVSVELSVDVGSLAFGNSTGLTFSPSGTTTGGTLHIQGTRSDVNAALTTLTYTRSSTGTATLRIALVNYGEVLYPANGHLYEYVSTPDGMTWSEAVSASSQRVRYGATGYLAAITSAEENSYIYARLLGVGWIGASDSASEGDWRWVQGPEAGTQFWSGNSGGSVVGGAYVNWDTNQPDNANWYPGSSDENCAQIGIIATMTPRWNDMPCIYPMPGFVVEYGSVGDMPNIPEKTMTIYTTTVGEPVDDSDGVAAEIEDNGPNGGDANNDGTLDSLQPNVVNFTSSVTSKPFALAVSEQCTLADVSISPAASNQVSDELYTYPAGMVDFSAACGAPGQTIDVTHYFYGVDPTDMIVRKYDPMTHSYETVSSANISTTTVGGQSVALVSYQVTDGGALDADGVVNGTIVDPVGLAISSTTTTDTGTPATADPEQSGSGLASTGINIWIPVVAALASLIASGILLSLNTASNHSRSSGVNL